MKRFNKTLIICFAVIAILAVVLTGCSHPLGKELLSNGGFETMDSNNKLSGWEFVYIDKDGNKDTSQEFDGILTSGGSEEEKEHGKRYISITTKDYATAYLKTSVKLYAGQKYLLRVNFKISNSMTRPSGNDDAIGGYIGFLEDKTFQIINVFESSGWVSQDIYFRPTSTAKYTFVAGIGREDLGSCSGSFEFDNLSITSVKEVPPGANLVDLTPGGKVTDREAGGIVYTVLLCLFATALVVGSYYLIRLLQRRTKFDNAPIFDNEGDSQDKSYVKSSSNDGNLDDEPKKKEKIKKSFKQYFTSENLKTTLTSPISIFIYTLLGAFFIRFILVLTVFGMGDTITSYANIALTIAQDGPAKLYSIQSTSLPTGWLYILSLFGVIGNALDFTEKTFGMAMLIRIPNILADLATCYMIFKIMGNNYNDKFSAVIAGTYALLPAMFSASVTWGMNMSIALAFLVAMISFMLEKKHLYVPIMYTLGLMFSNFMLIALPVVIGYEIYYCVRDRKAIMPIVITSVASFAVFYCLAIPFAVNYFGANSTTNGGLLVFSKMLENIKANNFISNSSFSFYSIFGLGNTPTNVAMIIIVAIVMILFVIYGVYMYGKSRNRLDYVLLLAMSFLLWSVFGIGSKVEFTLIGTVLLLLYAGLKMERRVFYAFGVLSVTNFVNTSVVLTKSGAINYAPNTGFANLYKLDPLYIIGSLIVVGVVLYLMWLMYDIMANGSEKVIKPMPRNLLDEYKDSFNNNKKRVIKLFQRKK